MTTPQHQLSLEAIRQRLSQKIRQQETGNAVLSGVKTNVKNIVTSGEIEPGTVMELLSNRDGSGALSLACQLAGRLQSLDRGGVVVVDNFGEFHPPGAASLGVQLESVIIIRPKSSTDLAWSVEQSLRCPGVAAVVCHLERIDQRIGRRLMLAAEVGRTVGLFLRPVTVACQSSFATIRLSVQSLCSTTDTPSIARTLEVQTRYVRGRFQEETFCVDVGRSPQVV